MKAEAGKFHPGPEHAGDRFDADRAEPRSGAGSLEHPPHQIQHEQDEDDDDQDGDDGHGDLLSVAESRTSMFAPGHTPGRPIRTSAAPRRLAYPGNLTRFR